MRLTLDTPKTLFQLRDTINSLVEYLDGKDALVDCSISLWDARGAEGDQFFIVTFNQEPPPFNTAIHPTANQLKANS